MRPRRLLHFTVSIELVLCLLLTCLLTFLSSVPITSLVWALVLPSVCTETWHLWTRRMCAPPELLLCLRLPPPVCFPSWCLVLSSLLWKRDAGIFCSQRIYPLSDSRKSGSLFITRASLPLKLAVGSCEPSVCPSVTRSSRAIAHLRPRRLLAYLGYVLGIIPSTLDLGMLLSNLVERGSHSPMTHNKLAGIMACI